MEKLIETLGRYRTVVLAVAVAAVLVVVGALASRESIPEEPLAFPSTTSASGTTSTEAATQPESEVPAIDCRTLLTSDEIADALAVFDRPADERDSFLISQSEVCGETLAADENVFVRIEPGNPDDFATGALLLGVVGDEVPGIGDGSLWFGGADAEGGGGLGVLTSRQATPLGVIHFRIVVGRPDLDPAGQRDIAMGLATAALPRFPGVVAEPPQPELISFEETVPDRSDISLYDNLLSREEAGEWSRGEGLVAVLRALNGDSGGAQLPDPSQLADASATGVIQLAQGYLESGPDQTARAEIGELLDRLLITEEELEEMSVEQGQSSAGSLLASLMPVATEPSTSCAEYGMASPCLVEVALPDLPELTPDKYSLYAALEQGSKWAISDVGLAADALLESAKKYEGLGEMPETTLVLHPASWGFVRSRHDGCTVQVGDFLADFEDGDFQQVLAREIAYCFIGQHLFDQARNQGAANWWVRGLANYLSGYVYPAVDFEHKNLPAQLAQVELSTTLPDRSYTNWVFFEHIHGALGAQGVIDMIAGFPAGGDHVAALAGYEGMADLYHSFARGLTDANVDDQGPGTVPYQPIAWDLPLTGPAEVPFPVPRFGVRRLHVRVAPGFYACFETTGEGEQKVTWRPGGPGEPGLWEELPPVLEGQSMIVITSIEEGARFSLNVSDVDDDPDCSDEEPATPTDDCDLNLICRASRYFFQLGD